MTDMSTNKNDHYRKTNLNRQLAAVCLGQSSAFSAAGCVYFHQCTQYYYNTMSLIKINTTGSAGSRRLPETNNSQLSIEIGSPIVDTVHPLKLAIYVNKHCLYIKRCIIIIRSYRIRILQLILNCLANIIMLLSNQQIFVNCYVSH